MNFSLIVCTYMRSDSLIKLLQSVSLQTLYPDDIWIIDGSTDEKTKLALESNFFKNLHYLKVSPEERGLTRQRNVGISKVNPACEIVCFLDDDTV
ncbi:MAG: glycosyltransferase family A protein, partial [Flavobacteriaceae bacterium]|nr:glycosyltransferase family A protein [Flavobacteriaceae bacterium]